MLLLDPQFDLQGFAVTLAAVYSYALALGMLMIRGRLGTRLMRPLALLTLFFPLFIRPEAIFLRALAEMLCVDCFLKLVDYARHCEKSRTHRNFREYCYLLMPFPIFQAVLEDKKRLGHFDYSLANIVRILLGAAGVFAGIVAVFYLNHWPLLRQSFLLEHTVKVAAFIFTVECGSRLVYGVERLLGFATVPLVRNIFLSVTVAEFWLRWNNRVHHWLKANLFIPVAKRYGRIGGALAVFGFSGLFHEIAFDVATGRGFGYQFAFFLLQTPLVLLSDPLMRAIRRGNIAVLVASYLATVLWMTATSMLFLRGVDRVFPFFYAGQPWLP